jgi:hypothetical protein
VVEGQWQREEIPSRRAELSQPRLISFQLVAKRVCGLMMTFELLLRYRDDGDWRVASINRFGAGAAYLARVSRSMIISSATLKMAPIRRFGSGIR